MAKLILRSNYFKNELAVHKLRLYKISRHERGSGNESRKPPRFFILKRKKMTLGEKIKTYRKMRGLTQKELGLRVGFTESTADSRIRKYENNLMKPKAELRKKLAKVLDVNILALSDIDISSEEDAMQVLFLLENQYGAIIKVNGTDNGRLILEFDTSVNNRVFNRYMLEWGKRYEQYLCDGDEITYQNWKAKFPNGNSNLN